MSYSSKKLDCLSSILIKYQRFKKNFLFQDMFGVEFVFLRIAVINNF